MYEKWSNNKYAMELRSSSDNGGHYFTFVNGYKEGYSTLQYSNVEIARNRYWLTMKLVSKGAMQH